MIISDGIQRVRDRLDDNNTNAVLRKWTDTEITRHFDEQGRVMFRRMIHSNKEWSNMTVHLQDSNAKTIAKNIYEWRLPTWIEAVTKVYERKTGSTSESTFSPYLWSPTTGVDLGREIPKSDNGRRDGWTG